MIKHICPISFNKVDHNVVRLASFFTILLTSISFLNIFGNLSKYIMLFVVFDFLMRIFNNKLSLLKIISVNILHGLLKIEPELIGAAPKRFAAGLGASFSIIIFALLLISEYFKITILSTNMTENLLIIKHLTHFFFAMLLGAMSLEVFFGFCVGCKIYSYIQWIKSWFKK